LSAGEPSGILFRCNNDSTRPVGGAYSSKTGVSDAVLEIPPLPGAFSYEESGETAGPPINSTVYRWGYPLFLKACVSEIKNPYLLFRIWFLWRNISNELMEETRVPCT
jgi:hypothetical protein